LLSNNWSEAEAEKLLDEIPVFLTKPTTLKFQVVDFENSLSLLKQKGFVALQASTHIVNLQKANMEEFLSKRGYQQAIKRGPRVRKISTESDLKQGYEIYLQACRRHWSKPKYPERFYQDLFEEGKNSDWLIWWLAEFKGKIVGYQINFNYRNQLIMWDAGFNSDGLNLRASDYLMGESLKWCRENKIAEYNLGGSPASAEGLIHFKEQWGGNVKQYFVYEKTFLFGKLSDFLRGR
jgi:predicted N-acyltransferase